MESSLDTKRIDELIEKYRAIAVREQRRVDEAVEQNENVLQEICSSMLVPGAAFGMSYARGYFGEKASIWGIPIDATTGLFMHALAACFDLSVDKRAQRAGKFLHDIANGAFASWTASLGAEFGARKRMEKPLPAPQPHTGAEETPTRAPRPMTYEDLAAIKAAMAANTIPMMPERQPTPPPMFAPQNGNPLSAGAKVPAPVPIAQSALPVQSALNGQPAPGMSNAVTPALFSTAQQKPFRFTQRSVVDCEAEMRNLLQSHGAPSDPKTVAHVLTHENPNEAFRAIVGALDRRRKPQRLNGERSG